MTNDHFASSRLARMTRDTGSRRLPKVLIVDDDPLIVHMARSLFDAQHYTLLTARNGEQGLSIVERERPHVLVLDNVLPDLDGLAVLARVRSIDPHLPVIFITAQGTSQTAIDAMKQGAFDYLSKPLDLTQLESRVDLALEARRLMHVPVVISNHESLQHESTDILVGRSPLMGEVFKAIGRAATRDMPVLLEGETGVGKALVARAIYQNSDRANGPFRSVKCTDFDPAALEIELFGASSTDGIQHIGRIEQCAGGALLLEEVGQLPPMVQSKFFRLLSTGQFDRVGGGETLQADVRVLCTTSHDLRTAVEQGRFRADLYYLLRSLTLHLPPLRNRREDIPLLVDHFVKRFMRLSSTFNSSNVRVSPEAMELFVSHRWPGNLDELQSVLQQALVENSGTVLASQSLVRALQQPTRSPADDEDARYESNNPWESFVAAQMQSGTTTLYADALAHMEGQVLEIVLESTGGNQARAAKILGITRGNLRKKLRALGLYARYAQATDAADEDELAEPSIEELSR